MAVRQPSNKNRGNATPQRSNGESLRWSLGLALFFVGLFTLASLLFYLRDWEADSSVLHTSAAQLADPRYDDTISNPCGYAGAWLGDVLMGRSFGLFGLLIPVIILTLGLRVIRRRPLWLNHSFLSMLLVMLWGSLSLGYLFGSDWNTFSSGWGGAYGIAMSELLHGKIGNLGTLFLLLAGWILIGVFINRNFINTVNSMGHAVVDGGERLVERIHQRGQQRTPEQPAPAEPAREEPVVVLPPPAPHQMATPVAEPDPVMTEVPRTPVEPIQPATPPTVAPAETHEVERRVTMEEMEHELRRMEQHPVRPATPPAEEDDPFTVIPAGGRVEPDVPQTPPTPAPWVLPTTADDEENPFTEVPLTPATDEPSFHPEVVHVAEPPQPEPATPAEEGIVVTVEQNEVKVVDERHITDELYDPLKDLVHYAKPSPGLLENYPSNSQVTDEEIFLKKSRIEETLKNFGIPIKSIHATSGPTVTLYEIRQAEGVKISKIQGLENDIAQSIEARGIRIIAPIPGKGTIGIEVPNEHKQIVSMYSSICSPEFQGAKMELPVVIGRTIQNKSLVFDLAKAPHLLVAGATGQGKSVGLNAIITSLLYTKHPAELKFVMIDPKMVEFSTYAGLERHFLAKMESEEDAIITDPKKAVYTLHALEQEMEERLQLCKKAGARNIVEYNEKFVARRLPPPKGHRFLPYIVVVIDEFADLIMTAKEVERPVMRLAQKARAVGIHLIVATQRPDVRVITGGIKANFPARIAFRVMQMVDSRTIIDQPGAQTLIGRGDMLFTNGGELTRVQCALVETREVERIVEYISKQQGYPQAYPLPDYTPDAGEAGMGSTGGGDGESGRPMKFDSLFAEIARTAVEQGAISVSMIQRNYEVGFNRAGRIMQQLQQCGIVGPQLGAKPRDILFHDLPSLEAKLQDLGVF